MKQHLYKIIVFYVCTSWYHCNSITYGLSSRGRCPESSQTVNNRRCVSIASSSCDGRPCLTVQPDFVPHYVAGQDPNDVDLWCDMQKMYAPGRQTCEMHKVQERVFSEMRARKKEKGIIRRKNRKTPPIMLTLNVKAFHPP